MSDLNDSHNQKVEIFNDCSSDVDKSEGSEAVVFFKKLKKHFLCQNFLIDFYQYISQPSHNFSIK